MNDVKLCRGYDVTVVSMSTLTWLDSSEHERRSVLELVSALNEPGTLDELGIGTIRDTIADTLFPGTSTIQTRARYFLFVPWILQMAEDGSPCDVKGGVIMDRRGGGKRSGVVSTLSDSVRPSVKGKCHLGGLPC